MQDRLCHEACQLDGWHLAIRSGLSGLNLIRNDWMRLASGLERPAPAHCPQWYEAFLNRPDMQSSRVDFLALYRGRRLAAVFPVAARTSGRLQLRYLCVPLAPELDILPDAVFGAEEHPREVFDALLAGLRRQPSYPWDSLMVRRVLEHSHLSRCVAGRRSLRLVREDAGHCCVIPLGGEERTPLSKKFRANLRNARNRLQAAGKLEFACHSGPWAVDRAFRIYVEVEASGWKARRDHGKSGYAAGGAMSLDASKLAFYRHLIRAFSQTGQARIYQLNVGGVTVATQIALVLQDVCYLLKTAYAEPYARLSPSHLLLERVIEHHTRRGDVSLINLISDYHWISSWQPQRLPYISFECFNTTPKGHLRSVLRHAAKLWAAGRPA